MSIARPAGPAPELLRMGSRHGGGFLPAVSSANGGYRAERGELQLTLSNVAVCDAGTLADIE